MQKHEFNDTMKWTAAFFHLLMVASTRTSACACTRTGAHSLCPVCYYATFLDIIFDMITTFPSSSSSSSSSSTIRTFFCGR